VPGSEGGLENTRAYRAHQLRPPAKVGGCSQSSEPTQATQRVTWDAQPQLKAVQERINVRFFRKTKFPLYLHGGIRDLEYPRDYVRNAAIHAGARVAATIDIENFFPSVRAEQVLEIWSQFFRFDITVAELLTKLRAVRLAAMERPQETHRAIFHTRMTSEFL